MLVVKIVIYDYEFSCCYARYSTILHNNILCNSFKVCKMKYHELFFFIFTVNLSTFNNLVTSNSLFNVLINSKYSVPSRKTPASAKSIRIIMLMNDKNYS